MRQPPSHESVTYLDECYDALVTTQFGEGLEETAIGEAPSPAILLLLRRLVRP